MPRAALPLAVVACVLLAGCPAGGPSADTAATLDEPTTTAETTRACVETAYDRKSVPDVPANVSAESAAEFAAAYENATVWNEIAADADNSLRVNTRAEVVNETDTGFVVYVSGGGSYVACHGEARAVADMWLHVNYFVNETTVVRLEQPENKTDDPRVNGGQVVK